MLLVFQVTECTESLSVCLPHQLRALFLQRVALPDLLESYAKQLLKIIGAEWSTTMWRRVLEVLVLKALKSIKGEDQILSL